MKTIICLIPVCLAFNIFIISFDVLTSPYRYSYILENKLSFRMSHQYLHLHKYI